jgi:hypothetical protein
MAILIGFSMSSHKIFLQYYRTVIVVFGAVSKIKYLFITQALNASNAMFSIQNTPI